MADSAEKPHDPKNASFFGDQNALPTREKPRTGHPGAMFFRGVFSLSKNRGFFSRINGAKLRLSLHGAGGLSDCASHRAPAPKTLEGYASETVSKPPEAPKTGQKCPLVDVSRKKKRPYRAF